jgi:hypothetical protein
MGLSSTIFLYFNKMVNGTGWPPIHYSAPGFSRKPRSGDILLAPGASRGNGNGESTQERRKARQPFISAGLSRLAALWVARSCYFPGLRRGLKTAAATRL